jgi:hypothetical protein
MEHLTTQPDPDETPSSTPLSDDEQQILIEQFSDAYADAQNTYDGSIRWLAGGGAVVTTSIATALHKLGGIGTAAVVAFLVCLLVNLISYGTLQRDLTLRLRAVARRNRAGVGSNKWTLWTYVLNAVAGVVLIAGGVLLAVYVGTTAGDTPPT